MMLPEVSVIVPNYNHASYLVQRIESILNQTFQDFELLILDDCSTDNSKDIIEQYRNHPKVKVIVYNEENSGSTFRQWNKGIDMAQGKYIWIAESDDVAETNLLETLLPPLQDNNVHIAYCQSNRLSGDGIVTGTWLTHTEDLASRLFRKNFRMNGVRFINKFLIYKNVIPNASAVVFRKSAFYQAGAADDCIETCADWLLWMKMLMSGDVYFHATALNNFRYHSQSV
ncbi:MAG: glycosyltransferase, partial [Bacteroidales bacterium]|nr:glycosyltransferase [Bacteroidales bacterium]